MKKLICFISVFCMLFSFAQSAFAADEYVVRYDDASVAYSGNWTQSTQNCMPNMQGSKMTTNSAGTAIFKLQSGAKAGNYRIYYFLAHTTSDFAATVGENTYTLSVSDYGYTKSATTVRQWIRIGGDDALFRLKGGEGISFKQRGYTRATSVLFVRMANVPAEGKVNFQRIGLSDSEFSKSDG